MTSTGQTFKATPSQSETVDKLRNGIPKGAELAGFAAEPILGSRNMLVLRAYVKGADHVYESHCVGPRGKINGTVVLPHTKQ